MRQSQPTVTLFLRIPPELRERVAATLKRRKDDGAWSATLQSVSIEAIEKGLALVGVNPAQLSHPAIVKAPAPSKATVALAKATAAKVVSGARKAASKSAGQASKASKRGGK